MDTSTMLATLAIVKTLPETSTAEAVAAANRAEAAAEAVEEELEGGMANVIMSQSTQPDDNLNKIWFDTSADAEFTVPEYDEFRTAMQSIGGVQNRVSSLGQETIAVTSNIIEVVGVPEYVDDVSDYSDYNITDTGWYVFLRINSKDDSTVSANTSVSGVPGYKAVSGMTYVDVAVCFDVAAMAQVVTIDWGSYVDTIIIKATDLGIRNLDYRTTFYVYDIEPFATWEYALTTDEKFVAGKQYYTENEGIYSLAEVTDGNDIPANTYYNHSKVTFSGMSRNVTYKCDTVIDCPQVYILPEIEDDIHGCWFEIRLRHSGSFSSTLQVPEGVKVATEHTQAETAGLNMVDLHYSNTGGVKLWRFLNTHSTIPE